jgi:hypothetical protein
MCGADPAIGNVHVLHHGEAPALHDAAFDLPLVQHRDLTLTSGQGSSIWHNGIAVSLGLPDFLTHVQQMIGQAQNAWISGGFDRDLQGSLEDWMIVLKQFGQ